MEVVKKGDFEVEKIFPRELQLPEMGDFQLHGVSQSGKTALVFQFLQDQTFFYFDFRSEEEFEKVPVFARKERSVSIFVFKTYDLDISKLIPLIPKRGRKIFISWKENQILNCQNFKLHPLTFEEFISFRTKPETIENSFRRFSEVGSFPIFARFSETFLFKQNERLLNFALSEFQIDILKDIANNIGSSRSRLNIYTSLKEKRRISKDRFYKDFLELVEMGYVFVVNEFERIKNQKYYLVDSATLNTIRRKNDFVRFFENLIVSEFGKRNIEGIFFRNIDFFADEVAYLFLPFVDRENVRKHVKKNENTFLKLNPKNIIVITMDFEDEFTFNEYLVEVISFVRWATSL
jgi:hypothetical protein